MRGSYYDVLGVSPHADEAEIRARYLHLMRRHHPDVNQSPMAHARASEIGEAFRALSDATLRSRHDAELAQQRQEAVSARAISLYRGRKSRQAGRRRGGLIGIFSGARLTFAAVVVATLLVGWQLEQRLTAGSGTFTTSLPTDDGDNEARQTIAALKAASSEEAMAMPPVSAEAIAAGTAAFRRIAREGDPSKARPFSEACHAAAATTGTWQALDFCVAFDQAAFIADGKKPTAVNADYFVDRHDRAAHLYVPMISSMDAIALRLDHIREQVRPPRDERLQARTARVLNRIAKRGRRLADAAWDVFDPSRSDHIDSVGKPRDF